MAAEKCPLCMGAGKWHDGSRCSLCSGTGYTDIVSGCAGGQGRSSESVAGTGAAIAALWIVAAIAAAGWIAVVWWWL